MSKAYRHKAALLAAVALASSLSVAPRGAMAFEIFGIKLFGSDDAASQVVDPVRYTANLTSSDPALLSYLKDQSNLVSGQGDPADGDFGLAVKARDDRDRLIAALYEKARYGAVVNVMVGGTPLDKLPPSPVFDRSKPVPVVVSIDVGPEFKLGKVALTGDAGRLDPGKYGLVSGGNAGSKVILAATDKIVTDLKAEGRPLARIADKEIVADHHTNTVDVTIAASSGPVAPMGQVSVKGAAAVDPGFVAEYSAIKPGEAYSPDRLTKAAKRLRELGTFSTVTVTEANQLAPDGSIPVNIEVSESKQRYFGAGVQFSSIDGVGLQGYWGHRNLFGHAESLKITGSVSRLGQAKDFGKLDYSLGIAFAKPGAFGPASTFTSNINAAMTHLADGSRSRTLSGAVGASYDITDYDTVSAGVALEWTQSNDVYGNNHYLTASLPIAWVRDMTDDKLNPTTGYRASVTVKPSYEYYNKFVFTSAEGTLSGYKQIGDNGPVLAARLAAGTLVGGSNLGEIPATRRFFSGGGGSVRGYSYQAISPRNGANQELGGRSYVTASFEARIPVTEQIGVVPFLDVGTVSSKSMPDFTDIRAGAGVGLRYATPFGPLRLDVAVPLKRYPGGGTFGVYAGVGQAF